ncbi:MAG: hypothetical protein ACOYMA_09420 [Bacteroidia bacterium]
MKKLILSIISICVFSNFLMAQNEIGKTEDLGRISLTPVIAEEATNIPEAAKQIIHSKLQQIATQNGISGSGMMPRFVITLKINILTKDIIPGPPMMISQNLEVVFFIADYIEQKVFSTVSLNLKGVGTNETKAIIEAIKNVNPRSSELKQFVETGKSKIIAYYNTKCDFIILNIQSLAGQKKYEEAIFNLTSVPDVCKECYAKSMGAVEGLYQEYTNYLCDQNLAKAKSVWAANMNVNGAQESGNYLSQIYPNAKCYNEAQELTKEIKERTKELWKFEMKKYDDKLSLQQQRINAFKEIGVAYAHNQTPFLYNLRFLF